MALHLPAIVDKVSWVHTAGAYSTGKIIGAPTAIPLALIVDKGTATLTSLNIVDIDKQKSAFDILFFDSNPGSQTDGGTEATTEADLAAKCIGVLRVLQADYVDFANGSIAQYKGLGLKLRGSAGSKALYALIVCRGSPTYTTTSSLILKFGLDQN